MSRRIHLVRHGLSAIDSSLPPHEWGLDGAGLPAVESLRMSGRLPSQARWFSSPEPKALATAMRLTDAEVAVVDGLREQERDTTHWLDDPGEFPRAVRRAFAAQHQSAHPGWEPLAATRDRVVSAVRRILAAYPEGEVVLVGHGTTWTLMLSELTGSPPDLDAWAALEMPDVWTVGVAQGG